MTGFTRASDPAISRIRAWRWGCASGEERAALAAKILERDPELQLFDDVESPDVLAISWGAAITGDLSIIAPSAVAWAADAERIASWRAGRTDPAACLVVVRQPLKAPDAAGQRDWAATVLRALQGDASPPEGLLTANFFASRDGAVVYNFAEWTSAEAHRLALRRGDHGQYGSIGASDLWRAARSHPAITPEHEVRRYEIHGADGPV